MSENNAKKRTLKAKRFVEDWHAGLSEEELIEKHGLRGEKQLRKVIATLIDKGLISERPRHQSASGAVGTPGPARPESDKKSDRSLATESAGQQPSTVVPSAGGDRAPTSAPQGSRSGFWKAILHGIGVLFRVAVTVIGAVWGTVKRRCLYLAGRLGEYPWNGFPFKSVGIACCSLLAGYLAATLLVSSPVFVGLWLVFFAVLCEFLVIATRGFGLLPKHLFTCALALLAVNVLAAFWSDTSVPPRDRKYTREEICESFRTRCDKLIQFAKKQAAEGNEAARKGQQDLRDARNATLKQAQHYLRLVMEKAQQHCPETGRQWQKQAGPAVQDALRLKISGTESSRKR